MQLLRSIMRRHRDFYAYVLPGSSPGTSDCCFKKLPTSPDPALPELVLTGAHRNISEFTLRRMSTRATEYEGASLDTGDLTVSTGRSSSSDVSPADGEVATSAGESDRRTRRLPPGIGDHADLSEVAEGAALAASFNVRAEGAVIPHRFTAILSPYRMISARLSNTRYSTNYVIFKVTHTLGISEYTQGFVVQGNSVSTGASSGAAAAAAPSAGFNTQGGLH
jgi:hypothetical protein